jgi:hypothetical protein
MKTFALDKFYEMKETKIKRRRWVGKLVRTDLNKDEEYAKIFRKEDIKPDWWEKYI